MDTAQGRSRTSARRSFGLAHSGVRVNRRRSRFSPACAEEQCGASATALGASQAGHSLYVKVSVRPLRRVCVPGASKQRTVLSTRLAEQHPVIFFLTRRRLETAGSTENTQACQWACLWEARSCCLPDTSAGDAGHTGDTHRVQPGSWSESRQRRRSGCVTVMGAAPSSPPSRPSPVSPGGSDSGSDMAVCVLQERGTKRGAEWRPVVEK
jgi:hypothetical protein